MNSSELHEAFRSGLGSELSRRLSDDDVWRIANDAYRAFVRLIGGIPDFTSALTSVNIVTGEKVAEISPLILRIDRITRRSDNGDIKVINHTDVNRLNKSDYGRVTPLSFDDRQGMVRYAVIGMEKNKVRWVSVPAEDDVADMVIYRLPVTIIDGDGVDLDEVEEVHHFSILDKMFARAFSLPLMGNPQAAVAYESKFDAYCAEVRREMSRVKSKQVREVVYGGL